MNRHRLESALAMPGTPPARVSRIDADLRIAWIFVAGILVGLMIALAIATTWHDGDQLEATCQAGIEACRAD